MLNLSDSRTIHMIDKFVLIIIQLYLFSPSFSHFLRSIQLISINLDYHSFNSSSFQLENKTNLVFKFFYVWLSTPII